MSSPIGVIGDKESVLFFKLFGFTVAIADDKTTVSESFQKMSEQDYGVIYITEKCASWIPEKIEKYRHKVTPAVVLIPDYDGSRGIGLEAIQNNVEKAVGQNIL